MEGSLAEATSGIDVKNLIHTIRGQQVMLDSDLAVLYGVETRIFNQAVKRNESRFPERFRFQLTSYEFENLKSQSVISSGWGGRRSFPYAFTEQGIAMLSAILRSDVAVEMSIRIMDAFVEMRRFMVNNAAMFERISAVELRQMAYQKVFEKKFDRVFSHLKMREEPSQRVFFDGQIYDAFSFLVEFVGKAEQNIALVDGYVDMGTLKGLRVRDVEQPH